jgi:hypothetical protein
MINKNFKILDLFSGTRSVRKALDTMDIEFSYIGIDIYSPEEQNLILDLSQDDIIAKVVAALPKGWIPDFIWASPVCSKFSIATAVKGGTVYFEKTVNGIKPRTNLEPLKNTNYKNYTLEHIQDETSLHLKMVHNMNKILEYYNVDYVIENPRSSYMVYYLNPMLVTNKVDYCMYGFDYKKSTVIYSKFNLGLKTCKHKNNHIRMKHINNGTFDKNKNRYEQRSSVPPLLIKQILNIFLKESYETRM